MNARFLILLLLFSLYSCRTHSDKEAIYEPCKGYPAVITQFELQHQFDNTKWMLYCLHCDEKLNFQSTLNNKDVTFGELPLRFTMFNIRKDSIEIGFKFYYNDRPCDIQLVKNIIDVGAVYKYGSDTVVYWISPTTMKYFYVRCLVADCPSRYVNPLQPEVYKYIRNNHKKLNPWFRKEAIRRGVISE